MARDIQLQFLMNRLILLKFKKEWMPRLTVLIEQFEKAFKEAGELKIPSVIDCHIDREDKVFPIVSPGAAISEAFDREDLNNKK